MRYLQEKTSTNHCYRDWSLLCCRFGPDGPDAPFPRRNANALLIAREQTILGVAEVAGSRGFAGDHCFVWPNNFPLPCSLDGSRGAPVPHL